MDALSSERGSRWIRSTWTGAAACSVLSMSACGAVPIKEEVASEVVAEWKADVEEWRTNRDERLLRPTGWLSLAGLFWLEDGGEYSFGSAEESAFVFPGSAPERLGVLRREGREVTIAIEAGQEATVGGEALTEQVLAADVTGEPTVVEHGSLSFYVIERGERVGIRLRDTESELLSAFGGMTHYDFDPAWRLTGRFEAYDEPRTVQVPNIIGDSFEAEVPGAVVFEVDGEEFRLEPTGDPAEGLFLVFGDETNRHETYGGGRFLYTDATADDGTVIVDFNKAYNPPCVFTPYATCPLPTPENKLALAIDAGEKMFGAAH